MNSEVAARSHVSYGSTAPRIVKAANQIATGVVTKLPRIRPGPERVTLIGLSNQETDHERHRSDPIEQSTAPSALEQRQMRLRSPTKSRSEIPGQSCRALPSTEMVKKGKLLTQSVRQIRLLDRTGQALLTRCKRFESNFAAALAAHAPPRMAPVKPPPP
jgi:hypothetical protein